jgi:hypothetical protein
MRALRLGMRWPQSLNSDVDAELVRLTVHGFHVQLPLLDNVVSLAGAALRFRGSCIQDHAIGYLNVR